LCLRASANDGDDDETPAETPADDDDEPSGPGEPAPEPSDEPTPGSPEPNTDAPAPREPAPREPAIETVPAVDSGLPTPEPEVPPATEAQDAGAAPDPAPDAGPPAGDCAGREPGEVLEGVCEPEPLQGYLLWLRPAGAAGTGPVLELLEDGSLRLWRNAMPFEPHHASDWDYETALQPEQADELVRLLLDVDYSELPHEATFVECYPTLYFEGPEGQLVDLDYGGAAAMLPEMQEVYDWFDALLDERAPEFAGPSSYCPDLP
jgi:hypothetical protein